MSTTRAQRIYVSEAETAALIRLSNGRVLPLSFGPSGVWIAPPRDDAARWAIEALAELRDRAAGRIFEDGGGI